MRLMANLSARTVATLSTLMVLTTFHGQTIKWLIPQGALSSEGSAVANDGTAVVIAEFQGSSGLYVDSYYTSACGGGSLQWFGGPSNIRLLSISEATDSQGRKYVCGWFNSSGIIYGIPRSPLSSLQGTPIQGYYFMSISTDGIISAGHDPSGNSVYTLEGDRLYTLGTIRYLRACDSIYPRSPFFVLAGRGIQPSWHGGPSATDREFHCVRMIVGQSFIAGGQGFITYGTAGSDFVSLPQFGSYTDPIAYSIAKVGDKVIAVGSAGGRAVRWTYNMQKQLISFEDLTAVYAGILPSGTVLQTARCISPNGRWIIGTGINGSTGRREAFLLDTYRLPSDINGDGVVDDADLLQVLFDFGRTICP
jgi:hypothetical protein